MDSNSQHKYIVAFNTGPETNESDLGEDLIAAMISCTPVLPPPALSVYCSAQTIIDCITRLFFRIFLLCNFAYVLTISH